jgi:mono/diheme cytochrome c family protein
MSQLRLVRGALVLVAIATATFALTGAAPAGKSADAKQKMIERGMQLTFLGGCNDCHTPGGMYGAPDFDRRLSGSELGWQGPWGVSYPRNLTPDMETGLGKWSEKEIATAIRTGKRPDGSVLLPPMPWPNYTGMSDEDAYAIAAFLKSIPAVSHRAPRALSPLMKVGGAVVSIPPPPPWDAPKGPPPGAGEGH